MSADGLLEVIRTFLVDQGSSVALAAFAIYLLYLLAKKNQAGGKPSQP
jgi:hypothetical protein